MLTLKALVQSINKPKLPCQGMESTNTSDTNASRPLTDFIVDVAGGEHGLGATAEIGFVQAAVSAALAIPELTAYLGSHSKSFQARGEEFWTHFLKPRKTPKDFEFSKFFPGKTLDSSLV